MTVYFADTSALSKRYVAETGSLWLRAQVDPAAGNTVYIVRITAVELIAALTRRERGGNAFIRKRNGSKNAFRAELASEYQIIEVDESLINRLMLLAETHGLRGYDAVQFAAAVEVNAQYVAVGLPAITVLSADAELNAAALSGGLAVENPNTHP